MRRDAEARVHADVVLLDREGRLERGQDPLRHFGRPLAVVGVFEQDRELVAAETRDGVGDP